MRYANALIRWLTFVSLALTVPVVPNLVSQVVPDPRPSSRPALAGSFPITITLESLEPAAVTIHPGDAVTWKNLSGQPQMLRITQQFRAYVYAPVIAREGASLERAVSVSRANPSADRASPAMQSDLVEQPLGVDESFSYTFIASGNFAFFVAGFAGAVMVLPENIPTPTNTPTSTSTSTPTGESPTATSTSTPTSTSTGTPTPTSTPSTSTPTPTPTPTPTSAPGSDSVLVAQGSAWRYLDTGSDQGAAWQSPAFNDAAWPSGPAPLGYGDPMSTTVSGGPSGNRFITTYFRTSFTVANPDQFSALTLQLRRDDGAVVYLNGTEVARSNMPAGSVTYQTLAASTVDGANETAYYSYTIPASALAPGSNTLAVEIHQRAASSSDIAFDLRLDVSASGGDPTATPTSTPTSTPTPTPTATGTLTPVFAIVAAGDVARCSNGLAGAYGTANLINGMPNAPVLALGDLAYNSGTDSEFQTCYDPTWGQFKNRTRPSPGNHEYRTAGAAGYFRYFGVPEYYSWDFGGWHFVSLNSEIDYSSTSAQMNWLRADLTASGARCTLAYWHRPRFSSGASHGSDSSLSAIWSVLQTYGVTVVLNGHEHNYERFGVQDANGNAVVTGIREFVVGTGGVGFYGFSSTPVPNSQFRLTNVFGVLKIDLMPSAYSWQFIAADGAVRDSGAANCN